MNIIAWVVFGALAGWIASMIMKTDAEQGAVANVVVGVVGAFLGGMIINFFNKAGVTGFNLRSMVVAIVGACVALFVYKAVRH